MQLPPLNALRAFEVAGRHESFLLASNELHVSPASVSRFIKMLEADLNQVLFHRHANGVALTEFGKQYLAIIQPSLQHIAIETERIRQKGLKKRLTIISIPAIAEIWLVSRLWSFQQAHKDIQINLVVDDQLVVNDELVNLQAHDATIVLNYSHGKQSGTQSYAMPKDKLTLVCNPDVAQKLHSPADIFNHTFLVDVDWQDDWQTWLTKANLTTQLPKNHSLFERYSMVVHATLAGSGVAIGHTSLLENYLKTAVLVAPFDIQAQAEKQFYAVIAKNTQQDSVKAFIDWFYDE